MDFLTDAGQWITQAASALAGIALALFAFPVAMDTVEGAGGVIQN